MSFDYSSLPKLPDTQETYNQRMAELRKIVKEDKVDDHLADLFVSVLRSSFAPNNREVRELRAAYLEDDVKANKEGELKANQEELNLIYEANFSYRKWFFENIIFQMETILSNEEHDKITMVQATKLQQLHQLLYLNKSALALFSGEARTKLYHRANRVLEKYFGGPSDLLA